MFKGGSSGNILDPLPPSPVENNGGRIPGCGVVGGQTNNLDNQQQQQLQMQNSGSGSSNDSASSQNYLSSFGKTDNV